MTAGCINRSGEGAVAEIGRWSRCAGFKRSIETVSKRPLRSSVKNLGVSLKYFIRAIIRLLKGLFHCIMWTNTERIRQVKDWWYL